MGKANKTTVKIVRDPREFPINKKRTFIYNLNSFINMLKAHHAKLPSKLYIKHIHNFTHRYKELVKTYDGRAMGQARQRIKVCKICDGWSGKKVMVQCCSCEDYYHENCFEGNIKSCTEEQNLSIYECKDCSEHNSKQFNENKYLEQTIEDRCQKCKKEKEKKQAFVRCLHCNNRFHKKCYGKASAVCSTCKTEIQNKISQKTHQTSILDYMSPSPKKKNKKEEPQTTSKDKNEDEEQTRTQTTRSIISFCLNFPQMSQEEVQNYKKELLFAIFAKKMRYSENLEPINCSLENDNQESLDFGLDFMSPKELQVYNAYKKQPIGPLKFRYHQQMGYDVVADKDIKEGTLICEYVGDVITYRECVRLQNIQRNDSIMELKVGKNSNETLMIRPQKFTNIARFINGVGKKSKNKANICTVRKMARGIPTVILYASCLIRKGDSLLYDYNAGSSTIAYDTSQFV